MTAVCKTASPSRSDHRRPAVLFVDRSPFKSETRLGRVARSAGASPATTPARVATTSVKSRTRVSTSIARPTLTGSGNGTDATTRISQAARPIPAMPPSVETTRLSVSNCRIKRPRLAPIARRTPISRRRPDARASSMFATFAHATSSTSPMPTISPSATGWSTLSACGCTRTPAATAMGRSEFVLGYSSANCCMINLMFASAC